LPTTPYVLTVIFLATLVRSTFGFGEALVAVPLLALRLPVAIASPLAVAISVLVAAVIILQDWRKIQVRSATGLFISSLFGIPLGLLMLAKVDDHLVKLILGLLIIAFSLWSLVSRSTAHLKHDHPVLLLITGFISGILGGAYGMNGPPLAIYGSLRRWSPQHFRATLQGYFLPASLAGLLGYLSIGLLTQPVLRDFLLSLPAVLAAILLGRCLNHRLRGHQFFRLVYTGLVVVGIVLAMQAVTPAPG
jgi:uncharacterized membrane protein YfcA